MCNFKPWDNGVIYYKFGDPTKAPSSLNIRWNYQMTMKDRDMVYQAMRYINEKIPCIKFRERPDLNYTESVHIYKNCTCGIPRGNLGHCGDFAASSLGKNDSMNFFAFSKCTDTSFEKDTIHLFAHELLHTVGLVHMMNWPTAKNYINVIKENIVEEALPQFEPCEKYDTHGVPYDCMSIMHYRAWQLTKDEMGFTMTAKDNTTCDLLSKNDFLTRTDIELVNKIYKCSIRNSVKDSEEEYYDEGKDPEEEYYDEEKDPEEEYYDEEKDPEKEYYDDE